MLYCSFVVFLEVIVSQMHFLKVTVLERSSAKAENFSFILDPSLSNVTVYVTGDSPVFTFYSPAGEPVHMIRMLILYLISQFFMLNASGSSYVCNR